MGLAVEVARATGSAAQIRGLLAGECDIAHTAADNVMAYVDQEDADLVLILVGELGTSQKLVARLGISSFGDLVGKTVGVDASATGYAFVLYKMLALEGVARGQYRVLPVGGTTERLAALIDGRVDAALLGPPHDEEAGARGHRLLAPAAAYFPGYPGLTAATRRSWARAHRDTLVRYCRALLAGMRWAADSRNRSTTVALLAEDLALDAADAERVYENERRDRERVAPNVDEAQAALCRVAVLRAEMTRGEPLGPAVVDVGRYFDPSYVLAADAALG